MRLDTVGDAHHRVLQAYSAARLFGFVRYLRNAKAEQLIAYHRVEAGRHSPPNPKSEDTPCVGRKNEDIPLLCGCAAQCVRGLNLFCPIGVWTRSSE